MEPPQQPTPVGPFDLRPEERGYAVGWVLFVVAGVYFAYRGYSEERTLFLAAGLTAILLGASQAAVIAVRQLRPWRKVIRIAWTVILCVVFAAYYALEFLSRPLLR